MRRLLAIALTLSLAGCTSDGLAGLPLPGGAPSGPSYRVTIEFTDVLDLVPQSAVKVNDVTVGSVEKVWLSGWTARVAVRVSTSARLPDNATAAVRQTSLLGEKFVALAPPVGEPARGELSDGDVIPVERTRRSAEVEEVLGALGLVLSGGGLAQLRTINREVAAALEGRESDATGALHQLDAFIAGLDAQKLDIVRAIEALDRLTARLARQRQTIGAAVDALGPGLGVLADQRRQLTAALTALGRLSTVGTRVIDASRDNTVASLAALRPILDQLVRSGDALPRAMDFLLTFPFPPAITGAIVGNQVNLSVTLDLDASEILTSLLARPPAEGDEQPPTDPGLPLPSLPEVPPLPSLPNLPLPTITPLPSLTPVPSLPIPLPTLTLPGLPLTGAAAGSTDRGLTYLLARGLRG
jgi:phospholipid/cholesterol/gamma-HCH transport system substrate-binding protein